MDARKSAPITPTEPVRRTSEIEEVTNVLFVHPVSSRLTPMLARIGVTPNAVSLTGMACGIAAGFAYHRHDDRAWACAGFALMVAWHVLDGTDGQLARLTNTQSQFGKVLDGVCDYVTFTAVYAGIALASLPRHGVWVVLLAMLAGACHAIQSAAYEVQRQDYDMFGRGRHATATTRVHDRRGGPAAAMRRVASRLDHAYQRLQSRAAGQDDASRNRLVGAMQGDADAVRSRRMLYREVFAPRVRRWSILSANTHTICIFVFAMIGVPLGYFWFEVLGLSTVLAVLLAGQRACYAAFFAALDEAG